MNTNIESLPIEAIGVEYDKEVSEGVKIVLIEFGMILEEDNPILLITFSDEDENNMFSLVRYIDFGRKVMPEAVGPSLYKDIFLDSELTNEEPRSITAEEFLKSSGYSPSDIEKIVNAALVEGQHMMNLCPTKMKYETDTEQFLRSIENLSVYGKVMRAASDAKTLSTWEKIKMLPKFFDIMEERRMMGMTIDEFADMLGIGMTDLEKLAKSDKIPVHVIGQLGACWNQILKLKKEERNRDALNKIGKSTFQKDAQASYFKNMLLGHSSVNWMT